MKWIKRLYWLLYVAGKPLSPEQFHKLCQIYAEKKDKWVSLILRNYFLRWGLHKSDIDEILKYDDSVLELLLKSSHRRIWSCHEYLFNVLVKEKSLQRLAKVLTKLDLTEEQELDLIEQVKLEEKQTDYGKPWRELLAKYIISAPNEYRCSETSVQMALLDLDEDFLHMTLIRSHLNAPMLTNEILLTAIKRKNVVLLRHFLCVSAFPNDFAQKYLEFIHENGKLGAEPDSLKTAMADLDLTVEWKISCIRKELLVLEDVLQENKLSALEVSEILHSCYLSEIPDEKQEAYVAEHILPHINCTHTLAYITLQIYKYPLPSIKKAAYKAVYDIVGMLNLNVLNKAKGLQEKVKTFKKEYEQYVALHY